MNLEELNELNPEDIKIMIERGEFNHLDQIGWLNLGNLLMNKYVEIGQVGNWRFIQKETKVYISGINNDIHRLIPFIGEEFDFTVDDLNYFAFRSSNTRNSLLKAKFADIVWQEAEEKRIEYAIRAAEGYLDMRDFFYENENFNYLTRILARALYLLIESDNRDLLERCVSIFEETINKLIEINAIRWTYDLLKAIANNYKKVKDFINRENLINYIENGENYYEGRDFVWKNRFSEFRIKIT